MSGVVVGDPDVPRGTRAERNSVMLPGYPVGEGYLDVETVR